MISAWKIGQHAENALCAPPQLAHLVVTYWHLRMSVHLGFAGQVKPLVVWSFDLQQPHARGMGDGSLRQGVVVCP